MQPMMPHTHTHLGCADPGDDSSNQARDGATHGTSSAALGPGDGEGNGDDSRANDNTHELQQQEQQAALGNQFPITARAI